MEETAERYRTFALAALPRYGFGPSAEVRLLSLSENGTFLVEEAGRRVVVRVHRPGYHPKAAIESELLWMAEVRERCGIATPVLVPAQDGAAVVTASVDGSTRHVDAVSVIDGGTGEEEGRTVAFEQLGRISAQMHRFDEGWQTPAGFERFSWSFDEAIGDHARWGDWRKGPGVTDAGHRAIAAAVDRIRLQLAEYGTGAGRYGLVHADLRLANLMVGDDGGLTVIDFDDCGYSWYLLDLGSVVSWVEHEEATPGIVDQWLRGYLEHRPLDAHDLSMVPAFVMMRRIMLTAWLASHPLSPPAQQFGHEYGLGTADLATRFLDDPSWFAVATPA